MGLPEGGAIRPRTRSAATAHAPICRAARPAPGQNGTGRVVLAEHVGAVDGKQLRESPAGTIDPALDCPHRGLADGRGLLMGEACRPDENERFALVRQQRRERPAEFLEFQLAVLLGSF